MTCKQMPEQRNKTENAHFITFSAVLLFHVTIRKIIVLRIVEMLASLVAFDGVGVSEWANLRPT